MCSAGSVANFCATAAVCCKSCGRTRRQLAVATPWNSHRSWQIPMKNVSFHGKIVENLLFHSTVSKLSSQNGSGMCLFANPTSSVSRPFSPDPMPLKSHAHCIRPHFRNTLGKIFLPHFRLQKSTQNSPKLRCPPGPTAWHSPRSLHDTSRHRDSRPRRWRWHGTTWPKTGSSSSMADVTREKWGKFSQMGLKNIENINI